MITTDLSTREKKQRMHAFGGFGRTYKPLNINILPKISQFTRWFTQLNLKKPLLVATTPKKSLYYKSLQSFFIILTQCLGQFFLCKCTIALKPAFQAFKTYFCTSFKNVAQFFMPIHHICDVFGTLKDSWRLQKAVHQLLKRLKNTPQHFGLSPLRHVNAFDCALLKLTDSIKTTPHASDFELLSIPTLLGKGA